MTALHVVLGIAVTALFAASGLLRPAKDVLSASTEADFEPSFLGSDSVKGTQYGIPWIASVRALGYNKQAFAKAGISSPPATWAQLTADAQKAKRAGGPSLGRAETDTVPTPQKRPQRNDTVIAQAQWNAPHLPDSPPST